MKAGEKKPEVQAPATVTGDLVMQDTRTYGDVLLQAGATIGKLSLMKGVTASMLEKAMFSRALTFKPVEKADG